MGVISPRCGGAALAPVARHGIEASTQDRASSTQLEEVCCSMLAPDAPHANAKLPPVDERLVAPETRYEIDRGVLVHVSPAHEPHGSRHSKISALLEAHVDLEFDVATDMLTRTSETTDVAPDVSVFPVERDPETGGRQLEHLAFEVVSTESLSHAADKAASLVARGVRRVFAIDIERRRALEWSGSLGTWIVLDASADIEDPALAVPLPVAALIPAAKADDAVARALLLKQNPVLEATRAQDRVTARAEGRVESKVEAVLVILAARGVSLDQPARARIIGEREPAQLDRWIARAATCATIADLFVES
jgi:Uma2 family endonuclease